jgi:sugar O-acyltransferase (sialic acid O-acetyltransferase NeuD family)
MERPVVIVGIGAQTKYALEIFHLRRIPLCGLIALPGEEGRAGFDGAAVLGTLDEFPSLYHEYEEPAVLLAMSSNIRKEEICQALDALAPVYAKAIHPTAVIARTADLGHGVIVNPGAVVQPFARIGNHVMVHAGVIVEHDCVVSDFVNIAPRATLAGHVRVGKFSTIYTGAVVIPTVKVGEACVVGAGAVVLRDVADGITVAGVPAKEIQRDRR